MIRLALACLVLLAGCSGKTAREPEAPLWLYEQLAVGPLPTRPKAAPTRPKAAPRPAPARKAVKKKEVTRHAIPAWCSSVPSWATVDQIEAAAKARGVKVTTAHRAQARACLNSKK